MYDHEDRPTKEDFRSRKRKRVAPMELILAHFNPKELESLDEKQGGRTYIPGTKTPHYKGLERLMSNPAVEHMLMQSFERHAAGGMIGETARNIEKMKAKGRFGDTEMAYIGPRTKKFLDRTLSDTTGGRTTAENNKHPSTGKPEYFGLSSMFGGLGKTISKGVSGLGHAVSGGINSLGNVATKALPGAIMGGMMGGPEGAMMGGLSSAMQSNGHPGGMPQQGGGYSPYPGYQPGAAQGQMNQMNQQGQAGLGNLNQMGQNLMANANQWGQNAISSLANKASQGLTQGTNYGQNSLNQGTQYGQGMMNQANQMGQGMANQYDQQQQQRQQQYSPYGGGYGYSQQGGYGGYQGGYGQPQGGYGPYNGGGYQS